MIFSRKISRTVPSAAMRYSELSPTTGFEGGDAGVPLLSSEPMLGVDAPPACAGLASLPDLVSTGAPGVVPKGAAPPGIGRIGVLPIGRLRIADAVPA